MLNNNFHRPDIEKEDAISCQKKLKNDLSRILNTESIILDVGANSGQFALEILDIVNVQKIISFEPENLAYDELVKLASKRPQIKPYKKAISIKNCIQNFFVTESNVGSSLLKPLTKQSSKWLTLKEQIDVETIRIDTFIEKNLEEGLNEISLLKSDAQGCDLDVLVSAGKYLCPTNIKAILVELNFTNFYENQQSYYKILEFLENKGYRVGWIYPHRAHDEWLWWADVLLIS